MKAILTVHGRGADNATDEEQESIRVACTTLRDYLRELLNTDPPTKTVEVLRAALREMHPDVPYAHALLIVRDVADVVVTLERLLVNKSRSDEIKILEAHSFCMHLAEPGPETGNGPR
jgi:hypothetical protein